MVSERSAFKVSEAESSERTEASGELVTRCVHTCWFSSRIPSITRLSQIRVYPPMI